MSMGKYSHHDKKGCCAKCGNPMMMGHPSKRFCGKKCKDTYHNWNNPRGKFAHLHPESEESKKRDHEFAMDAMEAGWDGHKDR